MGISLRDNLELVRRAENLLRQQAAEGKEIEELQEIHLLLRSSTLGLMVVYAKLNGLPDPREGYEVSDAQRR